MKRESIGQKGAGEEQRNGEGEGKQVKGTGKRNRKASHSFSGKDSWGKNRM
jgi:hypothetical protein